jgi:hypothetical protein
MRKVLNAMMVFGPETIRKAKCAGVCLTGWLRGKPCGAAPVVQFEGKFYCAPHLLVAETNPAKFEKAKKSWAKRRAEKELDFPGR